jgi:hypothetical protein
MSLSLQPITLKEASAFIRKHHSHHIPPRGWKFGVSVCDGDDVVGVATVGRPVSRVIQAREPFTVEVTRCCTDRTKHVASMLYAACWRAAKALGYRRLITYTGAHEIGTCLKAAGYRVVYETEGGSWDCPSRPRTDKHPTQPKLLWEVAA